MSKINSLHWTTDPEILEAFVRHRLDENEAVTLAAHLEQCVECRERVHMESEFIEGIRRYGRLEMKVRLKQHVQSNPVKRFDWTQGASIAAAIILMFGAVFAIRSFVDFEQNKYRTREIVLNDDASSQRGIWITGRVIANTRQFKGTLSDRSSKFMITMDHAAQTVLVNYALVSKLPFTQQTNDESSIRTLLERTPLGLQLTIYTDSIASSSITGVEPVTKDSLIVLYQRRQIAFHIPGGWAGSM